MGIRPLRTALVLLALGLVSLLAGCSGPASSGLNAIPGPGAWQAGAPADPGGVIPADGAAAPDLSYPVSLTATSIIGFEIRDGRPEWESGARARMLTIRVDFAADGTFVLRADARDDLMPLRGTFRTTGVTLTFSGDSSSQTPTGSATIQVIGSLDLRSGVLDLDWIATSGMAAQVNGGGHSSANSAAYHARLAVTLD